MAYCNGSIARGEWTVVYCDECAEAGAVPFTKDKFGVPGQDKPWCWAPWAVGESCVKCGKPL